MPNDFCIVPGCSTKSGQGKIMFPIVNDPERAKIWLMACNRQDLINTKSYKNYRICADHFDERTIINHQLSPNAVPTIFPQMEGTSSPPPPPPPGMTENRNVDIIQKSIGVMGRWHLWICFVIFLVKFAVAWQQLSIVFLAPPVNFTCANHPEDRCAANCTEYIYDRSTFTNTIIMEWDLVCDKTHLNNLAQTITMLGILIGNMIFGYLSDRFGRRLPLTGAVILQTLSGILAAYSPWFVLFVIMRFLSALATGGTMIVSFVLVMELIGVKWRTTVGIVYQIPFNLGHLTLPLFSYFLRDWKSFQLAISVPSILLISYYWILPESPRWLLTVGKSEEAVKMLENAAKHNHLPTENIRNDVKDFLEKRQQLSEEEQKKHAGSIIDLIRTPIMRTYTFCIGFNWLVCGLCFFGVAQYIGQLAGNIFLNVAISAVMQLPATLLSVWAVKALGRKKTLIIANLIAGLSMIIISVVPLEPAAIRSSLSCISMFGLAVSFPTVYIYSGELFPTVVRNVGVGTSSMCARIGSMTAPFVAGSVILGDWLPPVIFGIVPLIGAILCLKLPETVDCKLPDTIEEAELFQKRKIKSVDGTEMS